MGARAAEPWAGREHARDPGIAPGSAEHETRGLSAKACQEVRGGKTRTKGASCRFSRDPSVAAEARKAKGNGKKGDGKKDGGKGARSGSAMESKGKQHICVNSLRGSCAKSADAGQRSHAAKAARKVISAVYAGAAGAGASPGGAQPAVCWCVYIAKTIASAPQLGRALCPHALGCAAVCLAAGSMLHLPRRLEGNNK